MPTPDRIPETPPTAGPPGGNYPPHPPGPEFGRVPWPHGSPPGQQGVPLSTPSAPHPGYAALPTVQPAPWSGARMFFVTLGFAVLAGVVVGAVIGALVGGGLGALFGAGVEQLGPLGAPTPSPAESIVLAVVFGIMIGGFVGLGLSLFYGAIAAGLAAGLHTRLPAGRAGLIAAGVPSVIFGVWSLSGFGTDPIDAGITVAVIGMTIMFVPLVLVTVTTIRRSQRSAGRIPG